MNRLIPAVYEENLQQTDQTFPAYILPADSLPEEQAEILIERAALLGKKRAVGEVLPGERILLIRYEHDSRLEREEYYLRVAPEEACVRASSAQGVGYALTTLFWLMQEPTACIGMIHDTPRYSYRGVMLDVSRHFYDAEEVKRILEQCALLKINYFHWHLSDDRGYRLESTCYPELNQIGSRRREPDGSVTGGYYTKEEVRDVIEFARRRGIQIIPELDVPGHALALIASRPELSCRQEQAEVSSEGGIESRILCAGKDTTFEFLYRLFDEICEMFPGEWVHIGGDEVPKTEWEQCADCQARERAEGLGDEDALHAWFMTRIGTYLTEKGRKVICWNEAALAGDLPGEFVVQYWDELHPNPRILQETAKGRRYILSNVHRFYGDYGYGLIPLRATYEAGPQIMGQDVPAEQVMGLETPVWTEHICSSEVLEEFLFPRLCALAENGWSRHKDYEAFCDSLSLYERIASLYGIHMREDCPLRTAEMPAEEIAIDAFRMGMAENHRDRSPEENLQEARRKTEGWLKYLQGSYYSEEQRADVFATIEQKLTDGERE